MRWENLPSFLLPLRAWQTHCLIPFCPHSNSNNNIANSSCIEFIFVYHLVPLLLQLEKRFPYCCAQMWIVFCAMCVLCVCLLCCLSSRLRLLSSLMPSVCCLHTVHNVRIKLFSHYPVHSGFIKKFTMRCRSTFVGQPHTHTHIAQHILNHTHSSWHTHSHNVTDIAYHVSATFQLLHRECSLSLSPRA